MPEALPRPPELTELMVARETGALDATQTARLPHRVRDSVEAVLRRQAESGIDVASDGEQGKIGYATYVKERIVIDTCTNYVEHPDLVAERIERYASIVGASASSPAPTAASPPLHPSCQCCRGWPG